MREYHLSLLIQAGLLVRQLADTTAFWFAIPNVGLLVKSLVQVRRRHFHILLLAETIPSRKKLSFYISAGLQFIVAQTSIA